MKMSLTANSLHRNYIFITDKIIQQQCTGEYCSHFDIKVCHPNSSLTYFANTIILNCDGLTSVKS